MNAKPGERTAVIDARPEFQGRPTAFLVVNGQTLLERHLSLARHLGAGRIFILENADRSISRTAPPIGAGAEYCTEMPADPALCLSTLNVYRDRKAQAVWTLRGPDDLESAQGELERAEFFTISKHTLRPLGKRLAGWLFAHTAVTANHLTVMRILTGLVGAYCFSRGTMAADLAAGLCVLFSWFMDLTDGQLARLRKQVSRFGAYLDSVGDGVVDNLYYLAIAYAWYLRAGSGWALAAGTAFLFGKYVFVNSTLLIPMVQKVAVNAPGGAPAAEPARSRLRQLVKTVLSKTDDTDVRIHFLAVLAALHAPVVPLVFHAVYFNIRWVLNLVNAYYKYEVRKENR